ncbi:MAG: hypothetical protein JSR28_15060, partial [Proteobacteria bacterium]|nr:hypothetical protein [Pseudomonadota bacterium]
WQIANIADYSGDGRADLMWRYTDGTVTEWITGDTGFAQGFLGFAGTEWHIV